LLLGPSVQTILARVNTSPAVFPAAPA
jgi:hypothetical protein